jgi:hypothetical protein
METQETNRRQEDAVNEIIEETIHEIKQNTEEKLRNCAARLEEIGLPKSTVCVEMIHRFKYVCSERTIRRALGPEYKDQSKVRGQMSANEDNKAIEEDSAKIRERLGIGEDAEPDEPSDAMVKRLQEKLKIAIDERNFYRDQMVHYKSIVEAQKAITGDLKEGNEVVIYQDTYEELHEMMKKCPNGLVLQHDGYNVFRLRKLAAKKPYVQKPVSSEDVNL